MNAYRRAARRSGTIIGARQFFFVLSGIATLEVDGKHEVLHAHQGVEVPPGVPHQMFNGSGHDIEFIVTPHPPMCDDRVVVEPA
jgi:mannose-6-phosphate isomerase-like protein (cupin superfamily)